MREWRGVDLGVKVVGWFLLRTSGQLRTLCLIESDMSKLSTFARHSVVAVEVVERT